jgi:hypothetical protein
VGELIFMVEEAPEGGYTARALIASIFTEADTLADLHYQVCDSASSKTICDLATGDSPYRSVGHKATKAATSRPRP